MTQFVGEKLSYLLNAFSEKILRRRHDFTLKILSYRQFVGQRFSEDNETNNYLSVEFGLVLSFQFVYFASKRHYSSQ